MKCKIRNLKKTTRTYLLTQRFFEHPKHNFNTAGYRLLKRTTTQQSKRAVQRANTGLSSKSVIRTFSPSPPLRTGPVAPAAADVLLIPSLLIQRLCCCVLNAKVGFLNFCPHFLCQTAQQTLTIRFSPPPPPVWVLEGLFFLAKKGRNTARIGAKSWHFLKSLLSG